MLKRLDSTILRTLLVAILSGYAAAASAQQIHWHSDYSSAMMEAGKTGKPIFLAFRCAP